MIASLAYLFLLCSNFQMSRIERSEVADLILQAPGWVRLGIAAPTSHLRWDAANELAQVILDRLESDGNDGKENAQLGFSLWRALNMNNSLRVERRRRQCRQCGPTTGGSHSNKARNPVRPFFRKPTPSGIFSNEGYQQSVIAI